VKQTDAKLAMGISITVLKLTMEQMEEDMADFLREYNAIIDKEGAL